MCAPTAGSNSAGGWQVGGGACLSPDGSGVIVGSGDILYCLRNELKVKKKSPKKKKSPDK